MTIQVTSPIEWQNVSRYTTANVVKVIERAKRMGFEPHNGSWQGLMMDLEAASLDIPIDYAAMSNGSNLDFLHDVRGIHDHLNRETGKIERGFLPRFAVSQSMIDAWQRFCLSELFIKWDDLDQAITQISRLTK